MGTLLASFAHLSDPLVSQALVRRALGRDRRSPGLLATAGRVWPDPGRRSSPLAELHVVRWVLDGHVPLVRRPVDQIWAYVDEFLPQPPRWAHRVERAELLLPQGCALDRWWSDAALDEAALDYRGRLVGELVEGSRGPLLVLALRILQAEARGRSHWLDGGALGRARLLGYAWGAARAAAHGFICARLVRAGHGLRPDADDARFLGAHALAELERIGWEPDSPRFLAAALQPLLDGTMPLDPVALLRAPSLYRWLRGHLLAMQALPGLALAYVSALDDEPLPRSLPPAEPGDAALVGTLAEALWQASRSTSFDPPPPLTPAPERPRVFDPRFVDWCFARQLETWRPVAPVEALVARVHAQRFSKVPVATFERLGEHIDDGRFGAAHELLEELEDDDGGDAESIPTFVSMR